MLSSYYSLETRKGLILCYKTVNNEYNNGETIQFMNNEYNNGETIQFMKLCRTFRSNYFFISD